MRKRLASSIKPAAAPGCDHEVVNAFVSKLIDRSIIWLAAARMPRTSKLSPHFEEARQLLQEPDFFCDAAGLPADLKLDGEDFQFTSPIITPWQENNTVYGRLYRCATDWQSRPAVILLHGWNDEFGYRVRFPILARRLNGVGINCAMLQLPYHFRRRPQRDGAVRNFFSQDMLCSVQATRQAIADTRALRRADSSKSVA